MDAANPQEQLNAKLRARFNELPKVIQNAVTSADVEKQLRVLADTNKLHLDQWQLLENEVMLTLFGFQPAEELAANLRADLDISAELASSLAADISKIVFEPIRAELERSLDNPQAADAQTSAVEEVGRQAIAAEKAAAGPPVAPATPPQEPNTEKVVRAPVSESYKAGETSAARKSVHDDPYREPPQ